MLLILTFAITCEEQTTGKTLHKILNFHLISWCRKMCVSTRFPHQDITVFYALSVPTEVWIGLLIFKFYKGYMYLQSGRYIATFNYFRKYFRGFNSLNFFSHI